MSTAAEFAVSPAEIAETFYNVSAMVGESGFAAAKWLISHGAPTRATHEPDPVLVGRIATSGKFFDVVTPDEEGVRAILILARDYFNPIDIVAWMPKAGKIFTAFGQACMLGEEQIYGARHGEPLPVFRSPLAWFQASRQGVVIIDEAKAALRLMGTTTKAEGVEHGLMLKKQLALPEPNIVVATAFREAAE